MELELIFFMVAAAAVHSASITEELQMEVSSLKVELRELKRTMTQLEETMESNIVSQLLEKTIQSIQSNAQSDARKFWMELLNHANSGVKPLLQKLIEGSYAATRSNFYPILEFILKNNASWGLAPLYSALEVNDHILEGQEIFVLAYYLKEQCGRGGALFKRLPPVVQDLVSSPFLLRHRENGGIVIGAQGSPCSSRDECYTAPKTEVYLHRVQGRGSGSISSAAAGNGSHWALVPPLTMELKGGFNGTRMAWGFHLQNLGEEQREWQYLITKMRVTTFLLRPNTAFDAYFAGDLQCQYQPMIGRGMDLQGNSIMLGLMEKHLHKREFLWAGAWGRRVDKMQMGIRLFHKGELGGKVWDVVKTREEEDQEEDAEDRCGL